MGKQRKGDISDFSTSITNPIKVSDNSNGEINNGEVRIGTRDDFIRGGDVSTFGQFDVQTPYETLGKYDEGLIFGQDQRLFRAKNQSGAAQLGNAVFGGLGGGALTFIENTSNILDIDNNIKKLRGIEEVEQNWLGKIAKDLKEGLYQDVLPIYRKTNDIIDFSDSGFYYESLRGVVDSAVGFGLTGLTVGSIIGKIGGTALTALRTKKYIDKISPFVDDIAAKGQIFTSAYITNFAEGKMMALEMYEKTFKEIKDANPTMSERAISKIAGNRADQFMLANKMFIVTDAFALGGLTRGVNSTRNKVRDISFQAFKKSFKETTTRNPLLQASAEAFEEIGQNVFQMEASYRAKRDAEMEQKGIPTSLEARLIEFATSEQALLEGAMGFFGGPIQYAIIQGPQDFARKGDINKRYRDQTAQLEDNKKFFNNKLKSYVETIDASDKAERNGQQFIANELKEDLFIDIEFNNFQKGTTEQLERSLEDLRDNEELAKAKGLGDNYKEDIDKLLVKLQEDEISYIKLQNRYANPIFQPHLRTIFKYTKKQKAVQDRFKGVNNKYNTIKQDIVNTINEQSREVVNTTAIEIPLLRMERETLVENRQSFEKARESLKIRNAIIKRLEEKGTSVSSNEKRTSTNKLTTLINKKNKEIETITQQINKSLEVIKTLETPVQEVAVEKYTDNKELKDLQLEKSLLKDYEDEITKELSKITSEEGAKEELDNMSKLYKDILDREANRQNITEDQSNREKSIEKRNQEEVDTVLPIDPTKVVETGTEKEIKDSEESLNKSISENTRIVGEVIVKEEPILSNIEKEIKKIESERKEKLKKVDEFIKNKNKIRIKEALDKLVVYKGKPYILKREGVRFILDSDTTIIELDGTEDTKLEDLDLELKDEVETDIEKRYNIIITNENNVSVNGINYKINVDNNGNIISLNPLNNLQQTIKNERLLIAIEVERNKENFNSIQDELIEEKNYEEIKDSNLELLFVEGVYDKNYTDTTDKALEKLYNNENLTESEKLNLDLWVTDAIINITKLLVRDSNIIYQNALDNLEIINILLYTGNYKFYETSKKRKSEKVSTVKSSKKTIRKIVPTKENKITKTNKIKSKIDQEISDKQLEKELKDEIKKDFNAKLKKLQAKLSKEKKVQVPPFISDIELTGKREPNINTETQNQPSNNSTPINNEGGDTIPIEHVTTSTSVKQVQEDFNDIMHNSVMESSDTSTTNDETEELRDEDIGKINFASNALAYLSRNFIRFLSLADGRLVTQLTDSEDKLSDDLRDPKLLSSKHYQEGTKLTLFVDKDYKVGDDTYDTLLAKGRELETTRDKEITTKNQVTNSKIADIERRRKDEDNDAGRVHLMLALNNAKHDRNSPGSLLKGKSDKELEIIFNNGIQRVNEVIKLSRKKGISNDKIYKIILNTINTNLVLRLSKGLRNQFERSLNKGLSGFFTSKEVNARYNAELEGIEVEEVEKVDIEDRTYDFIPIGIKNENGKLIGYLHNTDFPFKRTKTENIDQDVEDIRAIRNALMLEHEGTFDTEVIEKRQGVLATAKNGEILPLSEAMKDPNLIVGVEASGKLQLNRTMSGKLVTTDIVPGRANAFIKKNDKEYIAIPLLSTRLSKSHRVSILSAMKMYLDTDISSLQSKELFDAGFGLHTLGGITKYIRSFMGLAELPKGKVLREVLLNSKSTNAYITIEPTGIDASFGKGIGYIFTKENKDGTRVYYEGLSEEQRNEITQEDFLQQLDKILEKSYYHINAEKLQEGNMNLPIINSDDTVTNEGKSYTQFVKETHETNVIDFDLGDGEFTSFVQPIIRFRSPILSKPDVVEGKEVVVLTGKREKEKPVEVKGKATGLTVTYEDLEDVDLAPAIDEESELELSLKNHRLDGISSIQQDELLTSFALSIFNDLVELKKGEKINLKKAFNKIKDELNIDQRAGIQTIKKDKTREAYLKRIDNLFSQWDKVEELLTRRVQALTGVRAYIKLDENEEQAGVDINNLDDAPFDLEGYNAKVNYDQSSLELDPKDTISIRLKRFLIGIRDVNQKTKKPLNNSYIPYEKLVPYDVAFAEISGLLVNTKADFKTMVKRLEEYVDTKPYIKNVITKLNKAETQVKKEFASEMRKHQTLMKTVLVEVDDKKGEFVVKVMDTNRSSFSKTIVDDWESNLNTNANNFKEGSPYFTKQETENIVNGYEKIKELVTLYQKETGENKRFDLFEDSIEALDIWLNKMGIQMDSNALGDIIENKWSFYTKVDKGSFDILAKNFNTREDSTINNNNYFQQKAVKTLANFESHYRSELLAQSFRNGENKTIFNYSYNNLFIDRLLNLKNDKTLLNRLSNNSFNRYSFWLNSLRNKNSTFNDIFNYFYFDTLKIGRKKGRTGEDLSDFGMEVAELGLFTNRGTHSQRDNKIRIINLLHPVMGDKKRRPGVTVIGVNTKLNQTEDDISDETAKVLFDEIILPELQRISDFQDREVDSKGFNAGAKTFLMTPELSYENLKNADEEDILLKDLLEIWEKNGTKLKSLDVIETEGLYEKLREYMKRETNRLVNEKLDSWVDYGIISKKEEGTTLKFIDNEYKRKIVANEVKKDNWSVAKYTAYDFVVNTLVGNANFQKLFIGDPAYFYNVKKPTSLSTFNNQGKRLGMYISPGRTVADDTPYIQATMDDRVSSSLNKFLHKIPEYAEIEEATDSQEFSSLEEYLFVLENTGRITASEVNEILIKDEGRKLSSTIISKLIKLDKADPLLPDKPIYTNLIQDPEHPTETIVLHKIATIPLFKTLTRGLEIDKVREAMKKGVNGDKNQPIDRLVFESGVKAGDKLRDENNQLFNSDGEVIDDIKFTTKNTRRLPREGFRIQQDTVYDSDKKTINDSTQVRKFPFLDLLHLPKMRERLIRYNEVYKELFNIKSANFSKKFVEIDEHGNKTFLLDVVRKELTKEILKRKHSINDLDILSMNNEDFLKYIIFSESSTRLESLLNSYTDNQVRKNKMPGFSGTLASEEGWRFSKKDIEAIEDVDLSKYNITFTSSWTGQLLPQEKIKNKVRASQILVPWNFKDEGGNSLKMKDYIGEDGRIDPKKLPPEILKFTGFRIPASKQSSMSYMEIAGFFPEEFSETVIASRDLIVQMGLDFDYDKLYLYNYHLSKKTIEGIETLVKYNGDDKIKLLQNEIISIQHEVLSDPAAQDVIQEPIGYGDLVELADEVDKSFLSKSKGKFNPLSQAYQLEKYLNARQADAGIGVFSLLTTFIASAQMIGKPVYFTRKKGNKRVEVTIKFGNKRSTRISKAVGQNKKFKSGNASAIQNVALDNENLQIGDKLNIGNETFGVINTLIVSGFDEHTYIPFINQPIIVDFIKEIARQRGSLEEVKTSPENDAYDKIIKKWSSNQYEEFTEVDKKELADGLDGDALMSILKEEKPDIKTQRALLDKFRELQVYGNELRRLTTAINTDSKGLPKFFTTSILKEEDVRTLDSINIFNSEEFIGNYNKGYEQVEQINPPIKIVEGQFDSTYNKNIEEETKEKIKEDIEESQQIEKDDIFNSFGNLVNIDPTTINGFTSIYALFTNNKLWQNIFPYKSLVVKEIYSKLESLTGMSSKEHNARGAWRFEVFKDLTTFIQSTNVTKETKERLFLDTENNKSLAVIQQDIKNSGRLSGNALINILNARVDKKTGRVSTIIFNNSSNGNTLEDNTHAAFSELLEDDSILFDDYKVSDYAKDLALYGMIAGNHVASSFRKYIPIVYQRQVLDDIVSKIQWEDVETININNFITQYIQHKPYLVQAITSGDFIIEKGKNLTNSTHIILKNKDASQYYDGIGKSVKLLEYLSYRGDNGYSLYKLTDRAAGKYAKIPVLGTFGMDEFNPNEGLLTSIIADRNKDTTVLRDLFNPGEITGDDPQTPFINDPDSNLTFTNPEPIVIGQNVLEGLTKVDDILPRIENDIYPYFSFLAKTFKRFNFASPIIGAFGDQSGFANIGEVPIVFKSEEEMILNGKPTFAIWNSSTKEIFINKVRLGKKNKEFIYKIILHEIVHGLTLDAVFTNPKLKTRLEEMVKFSIDALREAGHERIGSLELDKISAVEFVAEVLTDKLTQDVLSKIPVPKELQTGEVNYKNFLQRIFDKLSTMIAEFLGIKNVPESSLLKRALEDVMTAIDEQQDSIGKNIITGFEDVNAFAAIAESDNRFEVIVKDREERIKDLDKVITKIKGSPGSIRRVEELKERIKEYKSDIKEARKLDALEDLDNIANKDIEILRNIMSQKKINTGEFYEAERIINLWKKSIDLLFVDHEKKFQNVIYEQFQKYQSDVEFFESQLELVRNKLVQEYLTDAGVKESVENILGKAQDVSKATSKHLSINRFGNAILDVISKSILDSGTLHSREVKEFENKATKIINAAESELKKLGYKGELLYDLFAQITEDNKRTHRAVVKFNDKFFKKRRALKSRAIRSGKWSDFFKFKKDSTVIFDFRKLFRQEDYFEGEDIKFNNTKTSFDKGSPEIEQNKQQIIDIIGEKEFNRLLKREEEKLQDYKNRYEYQKVIIWEDIKDQKERESKLKEWVETESPYWYSETVERGKKITTAINVAEDMVFSVPKTKEWLDEKFEIIFKNKALMDFYELYIDTLHNAIEILPDHAVEHVGINSVTYLKRSIGQLFTGEKGMQAGLEGVWDNTLKAISSPVNNASYTSTDPVTEQERLGIKTSLPTIYERVKELIDIQKLKYELEYGIILDKNSRELSKIRNDAYDLASRESDFDLGKSMKLIFLTASNYKHKALIEDQIRIASSVIENAKNEKIIVDGKPVSTVDSKGNIVIQEKTPEESFKNMKSALKSTLKAFYGIKPKETGDLKKVLTIEDSKKKKELEELLIKNDEALKGEKIDEERHSEIKEDLEKKIEELGDIVKATKVAKKFMSWVQLKGMGWNFFSGFNNNGFGIMANYIEAADGRIYNTEDLNKAYKLTLHSLLRNTSLNGITTPTAKKIRALVENYNLEDIVIEFMKNNRTKGLGFFKRLMPFQIQKHTEYLNYAPVMISILLHNKDKNGTFWDQFSVDGKWEGTGNEPDMTALIAGMVNRNHGNYNPNMHTEVNDTLFGQMYSQFRRWGFEAVANRFEVEKNDNVLKVPRKGRFRTGIGFFTWNIKTKEGVEKMNLLEKNMFTLQQLGRKLIGKETKFDEKFNEADAANLRKNLRESLMFMTIFALIAAMKHALGDEDDEKKKAIYFTLINSFTRLQMDITFYINPMEAEQLMRRPIPVMSLVVDMGQWVSAFGRYVYGDDIIGSGVYAKDSRILRETMQFFPGSSKVMSAISAGKIIYNK